MRRMAVNERGQVVVFFALLLPILLALGSVVLSIGDWYVHKKNLQTLVDAGAFAGGTAFNACFQDPVGTNSLIKQRALEYSGDLARDASTRNRQLEDPNDTHVVLNSAQYWSQANGTDPNVPTPGSGYGLDVTLPAVDDNGVPTADGTSEPCSTKFLDVKATEDQAPLLWRWIPLHPSPKSKARVVIKKVEGLNGLLPWAVPEVDPKVVAALVVNEDVPASNANSVVAAVPLVKQTPAPNDPLRQWGLWQGNGMNISLGNGSSNFGVVVLTSRDPNVSLSGSLATVCQTTVQTRCYAGNTSTSGLSFIHVYSDSTSAVAVRQVQLTDLTCGADLSAPYFLLNGNCTVGIDAVVDFGVTGNPQAFPTCGAVSASPGGNMIWGTGGLSGSLGTWHTTITLPAADTASAGRTVVNLTAAYRNPNRNDCNNRNSTPFPKVAAPYVSNDASGPVQYLEVYNLDTGTLGNSINKSPPGRNLRFTVGLVPPLTVTTAWNDPPLYLRVTTNSSQTQAVDCDNSNISGPAGSHSNFRNEIEDGCYTFYRENTRNGDCSNYGPGNLPPPTTMSNPIDDCVITQTGVSAGQIRQALQDRFGGNPCKTLNQWPQSASDPFPDPATDPRYVILFIVDTSAFQGSGNAIYPIRRFGGFYLTGGDGLSCPGDDPPPPGVRQASAWGHFITYAIPNPDTQPTDELCAFDEVGTCIAVLVE